MTSSSAEYPANLDALPHDLPPAGNTNGSVQEIDRCLEELAQLAQTVLAERDFYAALLDRAVRLLAAEGGAAWRIGPQAAPTVIAQVHLPRPLVELPEPALAALGTRRSGEPLVLPPLARASARYPCDHPHPWPLILCPLAADAHARIVIAAALERDAGPDVQAGAARLLGVMAEIAGDFQRRRELAQLRQRDTQLAQFKQLVDRLHCGLDPTATAYTIANDGRQWIGCDRVSILRLKQGRAAALAVSAVDQVDRRSGQVASLERLAAAVAATGEKLAWHEAGANKTSTHDADTDELPPQLLGVLHDYLDIGHARQLVAIPLRQSATESAGKSQPPHAMLIAESFGAEMPLAALVARTEELAHVSGSALGNALTHHALPLLPLQQRIAAAIGAVSRRPVPALLGPAAVALGFTLLAAVPANFTVTAEGELQPRVRRNLFAPSDGVVAEVLVQHGDRVAQGDVLLRLHNPALDLDHSRLSGELQTAQARLSAVRSARSRPQDSDAPADENQQASEEEQLKQQIAGLENQLSVLQQMRNELTVKSPLAGIVLTWNTHELLDDRPVEQGQVLMTVADASGPWVLELHVPDGDAGHVLAGQRNSTNDLPVALPVTFLLASDPAVTHRGQLQRLAMATDTSGGAAAAEAIAAIDGPLPAAARAGGRVTARIHCGRRSVGYVWLHDLIDFARTTFWF